MITKLRITKLNELLNTLSEINPRACSLLTHSKCYISQNSEQQDGNAILNYVEIDDFFKRLDLLHNECIAEHKANKTFSSARLIEFTIFSVLYTEILQKKPQIELNDVRYIYDMATQSAKILYEQKAYQYADKVIKAVDPSIKTGNIELGPIDSFNQIKGDIEKESNAAVPVTPAEAVEETLAAAPVTLAEAAAIAAPGTPRQSQKGHTTHWCWYLLIGIIAFISIAAIAIWAGIPALFSGSTAAAGSASIGATAKAVASPGATQSATTPVVSSQF